MNKLKLLYTYCDNANDMYFVVQMVSNQVPQQDLPYPIDKNEAGSVDFIDEDVS